MMRVTVLLAGLVMVAPAYAASGPSKKDCKKLKALQAQVASLDPILEARQADPDYNTAEWQAACRQIVTTLGVGKDKDFFIESGLEAKLEAFEKKLSKRKLICGWSIVLLPYCDIITLPTAASREFAPVRAAGAYLHDQLATVCKEPGWGSYSTVTSDQVKEALRRARDPKLARYVDENCAR